MKKFNFLFLSLLCLYPLVNVWGWSMSPSLVSLDPKKPQVFFSVSSGKDEKSSAIEIKALKREIDIEGEEILTDASSEFLIYPSQVILKENSSKNIRVIWKGKKEALDQEKAYRIIATSLPVQITSSQPKEGAEEVGLGIAIGTRYFNSLYITPKNPQADVKCTKAFVKDNGEKGQQIVMELTNHGNAHQYSEDFSFTAQNMNEKFVVTREMIKKHYPDGINILAGAKRNIYIPIENETSTQKHSEN